MINLLIHLLIKDKENTNNSSVRQAYGILCGGFGIFLNMILFASKFFAGLLSHSISITADAFNNLSDAGSSIITLIGFKMSGQKPDADHPFGHGRIEYISGFIVSIAILLMGYELTKSSFLKILHPQKLNYSNLIIVILLCSIVVKFYMYFYNKKIGEKINSASMGATAIDSLSDTITTSVVLISTLFAHFTGMVIDGYCGVFVGLFIGYSGIKAAKETLSPLLGQKPDVKLVEQIESIVTNHPLILGLHDLIIHDYGPGNIIISLHAEVPADGDILLMHDTIDLIENQLRTELNCEATIHMDPVQNNDPETIFVKTKVLEILEQIDPSLTLHDFRIVS